jgi:NTP pyrophosphatase (non-canonical NTP hydrolase)
MQQVSADADERMDMMAKKIVDYIGYPAMLEQLAEECAELGKAALKLARIVRKENPTPVKKEEALENLREEYTDVIQCAQELGLKPDLVKMKEKKERFFERWKDRGKGEGKWQ